MVPPLPGVPVPVTVRPPLALVLSRMMPTPAVPEAVPAVMLWKVRPLAPMVVLATFKAVAVVVVRVLFAPVTFTTPPPVAAKAALAPVLTVRPPVKLLMEPALAARVTPVPPVIFTKPANVALPPVRLTMTMELFVALVMPPE